MDQGAIGLAHRLFDAIAAGDPEAMLAVVAADAVLWQNHVDQEQTFGPRVANLARASTVAEGLHYAERRYTGMPDGVLVQHRLRGVAGGVAFDAPIIVRAYDRGGRFIRLEEYFDPRALAPLYAAMAPSD